MIDWAKYAVGYNDYVMFTNKYNWLELNHITLLFHSEPSSIT